MRTSPMTGIGGLTLGLVALIAGSVSVTATEPPFDDPLQRELAAAVERLPEPPGDDATQLRRLLGPPDAFSIAFEPTGDGATSRREHWYYYDLSTAFELADGELLMDVPLDSEVELLLHTLDYDPADFGPVDTWASLAPVVGDPEAFEEVALDPEYGLEATIRVGNQLLLAFDDEGRLFYVETVPLTPGAPA